MSSKQTIFRHCGYEMRSHSETRWASIMDALSIGWVYEPEVFTTRHGWYVPDFFIPAAGVYLEVKGASPSEIEKEKACDVEIKTGCPVLFGYGDMEIIGGELYHGIVSYEPQGHRVAYSTAELGDIVRQHLDSQTYAAYLRAGHRRERPSCVLLGDALVELIQGMQSREQLERYKRETHAPINVAKSEQHRTKSPAEHALGLFAHRASVWRSQKVAA
jgi:hypothetical protein